MARPLVVWFNKEEERNKVLRKLETIVANLNADADQDS
jgi:hypothetical protein